MKLLCLLSVVLLTMGITVGSNAAIIEIVDIGEVGDDDDPQVSSGSILGEVFGDAEIVDGRSVRPKTGTPLEFVTITMPPDGGTLLITYYDDSSQMGGANARLFLNHLDGGTWEDELLGVLPFDGLDAWRTVGLPLPNELYENYLADITCLNDTADAPWICDYSTADGWQGYLDISMSPGFMNIGDPVYFDKVEIDSSKTWVLDIGDNADANFADREPMYIPRSSIDDGNWSAITTIAGQTCRLTVAGLDAPFYGVIDDDIQSVAVTVYDDDASEAPGVSLWVNYLDGDSWKDFFIGNIRLDGTGGWETTTLAVPASVFSLAGDARESSFSLDCSSEFNLAGHQILMQIWDYDSMAGVGDPPAFEGDLAIDRVVFSDEVAPTPSPTPEPTGVTAADENIWWLFAE